MVRVDVLYSKVFFIQKSFVISHYLSEIVQSTHFSIDTLCEFMLLVERQCSVKTGKSV